MTDEADSSPGDLGYRESLGRTLRRGSVSGLRAFLIGQAEAFGNEQHVQAIISQTEAELQTLMHRMILARTDLADLHPLSRAALGMQSAPKAPGASRPRRQT
ncbi:MAG: hypothetical protein ACKVVP_19730 [Chloroflexota bacterium]